MRILIEVAEREQAVDIHPELPDGTKPLAVSAGAPSAKLLGTIATVLPTPGKQLMSGEKIDAGGPPQWLVTSLATSLGTSLRQGATTVTQPAPAGKSGGTAPS